MADLAPDPTPDPTRWDRARTFARGPLLRALGVSVLTFGVVADALPLDSDSDVLFLFVVASLYGTTWALMLAFKRLKRCAGLLRLYRETPETARKYERDEADSYEIVSEAWVVELLTTLAVLVAFALLLR